MKCPNNEIMFSSWLLYLQILNDINSLSIYSFTKKLLSEEIKSELQALIIKQHCQMYNLKIKNNE